MSAIGNTCAAELWHRLHADRVLLLRLAWPQWILFMKECSSCAWSAHCFNWVGLFVQLQTCCPKNFSFVLTLYEQSGAAEAASQPGATPLSLPSAEDTPSPQQPTTSSDIFDGCMEIPDGQVDMVRTLKDSLQDWYLIGGLSVLSPLGC